jgi:hypothetical protein
MSNTVKSTNMSNIRLELWYKTMKYYLIILNQPHIVGSDKLPYMKEMFDYMMGDLWWIYDPDNEQLVKDIKEKLILFNKIRAVSQYYKEYFRNVEEAFGFATYCCSNTGDYRCENTIIKGEKNNYCEMHKKYLR